MAMPFHDAASKTATPGGTRTSRPDGANRSTTRPVPSWGATEAGGPSIRVSRREPTEPSSALPSRRSPFVVT